MLRLCSQLIFFFPLNLAKCLYLCEKYILQQKKVLLLLLFSCTGVTELSII